MAVPYVFQTQTGSIALSQLDSNFATPITFGATPITLGQTVSTIDVQINGISFKSTTGIGIGLNALYSASTGSNNIAIGDSAGYALTTSTDVVAVGFSAALNFVGTSSVAVGSLALAGASASPYNVAVGTNALGQHISTSLDGRNVAVGAYSGYNLTTGHHNLFLGNGSGQAMTTGTYNTIVGTFDGFVGSFDIRTSSNNIVLADGSGYPKFYVNSDGKFGYPNGATIGGAVSQGTSRATAVTLNKITGAITLFSAAPVVGTWYSFQVNNTTVKTGDIISITQSGGSNTYFAHATKIVDSTSFVIVFQSVVGTTADAPVFYYSISRSAQA